MNIDISIAEFWLALPLMILFITSVFPITSKVLFGNIEKPELVTLAMGLFGVVVAGMFVVVSWMGSSRVEGFQGALLFDGLASWSALTVLFITGMTLVFSYRNPATRGHGFSEHVFLVMSSALG